MVSVTKQKQSKPPAITLAGDPRQLGPIIRLKASKTFGLDKSLLERLSEMEPYAGHDDIVALGNH